MKVDLLRCSSKVIRVEQSFPELAIPSYTIIGSGFLLLTCAFLGLLTIPVASLLNLDPKNILVVLVTYSIGFITILGGIFAFLKSQTLTRLELDKSFNTATLTSKKLIRRSVKTYPLSDVTGIGQIYRKDFVQVVIWLKVGDK